MFPIPRRLLRSLIASASLALPALLGCTSSSDVPSAPLDANTVPSSRGAVTGRAATESPQADDVIAALKGYEAAIISEDTTALKKIWADDYTFINPQGGIVTKEQRLDNLRSGATSVVEGINQREIVVHVYGDMAVVTQLFTLRGTFSGVVTDQEVRGSFTWIKRAGRWQLVFNEITPVL